MSGLYYGNIYKSKKGIRTDRDLGVVYSDLSEKWVVRIKKNGQVKTIAQFKDKIDAEKCYKEALLNTT